MAASGFGRGWVRVARVEASRVWYARSSRWILIAALVVVAVVAAVPAIIGGLIAQDDVVPPDLNLDDAGVVGSLYLAGAGMLAVPALLWGMLIGDPRAPRKHDRIVASVPSPAMSASSENHMAEPETPAAVPILIFAPATTIRRGSLADSRIQRHEAATTRQQRALERERLRLRSARIAERVEAQADPRAAVIARVMVAGVAGMVLGLVMLVAAVFSSAIILTVFGSSLLLTNEHTLVIAVRLIVVAAVVCVIGAGLGSLMHGLRPAILRPVFLTVVALAVVGVDVGMRIAQAAGNLPDAALRFVPSTIIRAACGVIGTGFPPAAPIAASGPGSLAVLIVVALLSVAGATTRAAIASRRLAEA